MKKYKWLVPTLYIIFLMLKISLRLIGLFSLNYLVIVLSNNINVYQLFIDLNSIRIMNKYNEIVLYIIISISVSLLTLFLIYFFRPFIEIYLLHFLKFNFYFLINLISISTIYIVFRIYGYSRLYLLIYLLLSSLILYKSESI